VSFKYDRPQTLSDHIMRGSMYGMYHLFNFLTRYKTINPEVRAIEWRLIILESVSGVPAFIAAAFRHFRSLRTLQRDYGWIATLLEEAENERMHLLICLNMFHAGKVTRLAVVAAQTVITPILAFIYLIKPAAMHRFVGYLEETACKTYVNVIDHIETPGTKLHAA
jgi:Alternative oxidase